MNGNQYLYYPFSDLLTKNDRINSISTIYNDQFIILQFNHSISLYIIYILFLYIIFLNIYYIRIFSLYDKILVYTIHPPESNVRFNSHWIDINNKILILGMSNGTIYIHSLTYLKKQKRLI